MASTIDFRVETLHEEMVFVLTNPMSSQDIQLAISDGGSVSKARLTIDEIGLLIELLKAAQHHLLLTKQAD